MVANRFDSGPWSPESPGPTPLRCAIPLSTRCCNDFQRVFEIEGSALGWLPFARQKSFECATSLQDYQSLQDTAPVNLCQWGGCLQVRHPSGDGETFAPLGRNLELGRTLRGWHSTQVQNTHVRSLDTLETFVVLLDKRGQAATAAEWHGSCGDVTPQFKGEQGQGKSLPD